MHLSIFFISLGPHAPPQNVRENSTTSASILSGMMFLLRTKMALSGAIL